MTDTIVKDHLDKIKPRLLRQPHGLGCLHHSDLLVVRPDQPHRRDPDQVVHACALDRADVSIKPSGDCDISSYIS